MTTHTVRITSCRPNLIQRLWYWHLRIPAPLSVGSNGPRHADWARLAPYRLRGFHRRYAQRHRYFWVPCVLCDLPYGGHESGGGIPDPMNSPSGGISICSRCTRAGRHQEAP